MLVVDYFRVLIFSTRLRVAAITKYIKMWTLELDLSWSSVTALRYSLPVTLGKLLNLSKPQFLHL